MGSAAAYHLARRGADVCAVDQFEPGHDRGSSHGLTRIIRLAYHEDLSYVPLLRRAFDLWRELEAPLDAPLLHVTGSLDAGPEGSRIVDGSRHSCEQHGLPHERLSGAGVNERFPGYRLPDSHQAVLQPDGGFLDPEACIAAHVNGAARAGARLLARNRVHGWRATTDRVEVDIGGTTLAARRLVLCAGAWAPRLVPELAGVLRPERQVVAWFSVREPALFAPARFPVFNLETTLGHFYGFPEHGVPGFKIGRYHHRGEPADPDDMDRAVHAPDEAVLRAGVARCFPLADGPLLRAATCLFTNTPDEHFVVDRLPWCPRVLLVSACSGHGFKFCSVLGEIVADLVLDGRTRHDISRFAIARLPLARRGRARRGASGKP